jgi:hypothetical protein
VDIHADGIARLFGVVVRKYQAQVTRLYGASDLELHLVGAHRYDETEAAVPLPSANRAHRARLRSAGAAGP